MEARATEAQEGVGEGRDSSIATLCFSCRRRRRRKTSTARKRECSLSNFHFRKKKRTKTKTNIEKIDTKGSTKKGTRWTDKNEVEDAWIQWAVEQGLQIEDAYIQAASFSDYWIAISGSKGTKLDWQATWRNWIRNTMQRKPPTPIIRAVEDPTVIDSIVADLIEKNGRGI